MYLIVNYSEGFDSLQAKNIYIYKVGIEGYIIIYF